MDVAVYQTYYQEAQKESLEPAFLPLDNTANPYPEYCEYWLFLRHYRKRLHQQSAYSGVVSWKWFLKTNVAGDKFLQFVRDHPGHDVYFLNPAPDNVGKFRNIWLHGDEYHPGLLAYTQKVFDALGYAIDLKQMVHTRENLLFCNYWVGNAAFWDAYVAFTLPVFEYVVADLREGGAAAQIANHKWTCYQGRMTYFPFIFERLFSTLLVHRSDLRGLSFAYPPEYNSLVGRYHGLCQEYTQLQAALVSLRKAA